MKIVLLLRVTGSGPVTISAAGAALRRLER